jgi:segregation and condensation protein A
MAARTDLAKENVVGPLGVVAPPPIHVDCEAFSGSLAALFECVRKQKVELLRVPIFPICEAYFRYLMESANQDLDSAGAALAALSYLVERKAWLLLPVPESEEIEEYFEPFELSEAAAMEFQAAIQALSVWQEERERHFFRGTDGGVPYEVPFDLGEVTADDLARAFERLLLRASPEPIEPLGKARRSLTEQMGVVLVAITERWATLDELVVGEFTRTEAVWWFLALLELIRLGQAAVRLEEGEVFFARAQV